MLSIKRRLAEARESDGGFTLIELAVVILIIGILLAIAIPTFLGIRKNAQNKTAQSSVRNALVAAKGAASDDGTYKNVDATVLANAAPETSFVAAGSTGPKIVSWSVSAANVITFAALSQSKDCYVLRDSLDDDGTIAKLQYGKVANADAAACTASTVAPVAWANKW